MKNKITVSLILILIAIIILPTLTIEDAFTTIPLIGAIGIQGYILLCIGIIGLLYITGMLSRLARMLHVPPKTLLITLLFVILIYYAVVAG